MVELIQKLLLTNNCVIIPNFGAFIGNYNPAEIRLMVNKILPPNKIIAFNRSLQKNDGLLINTVSHYSSITYQEAEIKVTEFTKQCNDSLTQHKSLILKDIGRLVQDAENNIQFQPYYTKNYWLDSFGLPVMALHPIQRLKDTELIIKETYQRILHPELMENMVTPNRKSAKVTYWVTAGLAIALLVSTLTWNIYNSNAYQNESSMIPVFDTPTIQPKIKEEKVVVPVTQSNDALHASKKEMETTVVAPIITTTSKNKSYIVIGAFFDEIRANKLKVEAEGKGYIANITKDIPNGLFRTTVQVENAALETTLQKVKSEINHRAWIYCVKCNLK